MPLNIKTIYKDSSGNKRDPDKYSKELGQAHCELWSGRGKLGVLTWNPLNRLTATTNSGVELILTPDSITNGFIDSERTIGDKKEKELIKEYGDGVQKLINKYVNTDYTIGSSIVFPISINGEKIRWTMNIARGLNYKVHDRFDYTLECIKRFYEGNIDNPLQSALERSRKFFEIFTSFEDYVHFFFLDDLIDENGNVKSFTDIVDFSSPFPMTKEEYIKYLTKTMEFVEKRNTRISNWIEQNQI